MHALPRAKRTSGGSTVLTPPHTFSRFSVVDKAKGKKRGAHNELGRGWGKGEGAVLAPPVKHQKRERLGEGKSRLANVHLCCLFVCCRVGGGLGGWSCLMVRKERERESHSSVCVCETAQKKQYAPTGTGGRGKEMSKRLVQMLDELLLLAATTAAAAAAATHKKRTLSCLSVCLSL